MLYHGSTKTKAIINPGEINGEAHDKLNQPSFSLCPQCHEPLLPHHICQHCGYYKGKEIIAVEEEE